MKNWFIHKLGQLKLWLEKILENDNEREFRRKIKTLESQWEEVRKYRQSNCPHIAGCNELSEESDLRGRTSIVWHRLDHGVETGLCQNCQRLFQPTDPDYAEWKEKLSFNKMSAAGIRYNFSLPVDYPRLSSILTGPVDWKQPSPRQRLQRDEPFDLPDFVPSNEDLDELSDSEISDLLDKVRVYYKEEREREGGFNCLTHTNPTSK